MKFKKLTAMAMTAVMLASGTAFADGGADEKISVIVDGKTLQFDQPPVMESDRVLVPFRAIFEALGCSVDYYSYGETETVNAKMGSKNLSLTIGSTEIYASGEAKTIDVAPKIVNDRTLVPVRVASESFGAEVVWDEAENTVKITSKQGFYKITRSKVDYAAAADDGTTLFTATCYYPVIENAQNDEFITALNTDTLNAVNEFTGGLNNEFKETANEEYESLKANPDENGREFLPYTFEFDYDIDLNTENYLSMTAVLYYDLHGAHPTTAMTSVTYDMKEKKELALSDIWNMDETAVTNEVIAIFNEDIDKNPDMYFKDAKEKVEKIAKDVEFYLDEEGVNLYFQLYDLAPYAAGYPQITVPFEGNEQMYKIKLAPTLTVENQESANSNTLKIGE